MNEMFRVGERIKFYRLQKGITIQQLAKDLSLSEDFVVQLETGKRRTTLYNMIKLAHILQVDIDVLLCDFIVADTDILEKEIMDNLALLEESNLKDMVATMERAQRYLQEG